MIQNSEILKNQSAHLEILSPLIKVLYFSTTNPLFFPYMFPPLCRAWSILTRSTVEIDVSLKPLWFLLVSRFQVEMSLFYPNRGTPIRSPSVFSFSFTAQTLLTGLAHVFRKRKLNAQPGGALKDIEN